VFFLLSKTLDLLLSPLTWAVVLLGLAIPWRKPKSQRRTRGFGLAALVVLLVFSSDVVSQSLYRGLESSAKDTRAPGQTYDAVVVLGGMVDGRPGIDGSVQFNDNVERITVAYGVLRRGEARYAIVSGGALDADKQVVEGRLMRDQLLEWGIPDARILVEDRAINTHENAAFVKPIAQAHGFQKLLLVTSAYHMLRSEECFAAEGLAVDTLPADFRAGPAGTYSGRLLPRAEYLSDSTAALREMFGRVVYRARGYAKPIPIEPRRR